MVRWEAGDHEPLPCVRPKMARLLAISRNELTELLWPRPSVHVGDVVSAVGNDDPGDHLPAPGGMLLPVVIDGHPVFLPLDAGELLKGRCHRGSPTQDDGARGWSSADGTLNDAERLDSTIHAIVELSEVDLKRRHLLLRAAFTTAAFAEPALFALTTPPVANAARNSGSRRIGMTDVEILTDNVRYYIQGLNLAMHAGNRLFAANLLSDMSRMTIQNATGRRCAHQAVALARAGKTRDALHTAGQVSSGRTVSRIRALQQQIRPLHSVGLAELNGEITAFLHRARDDKDITT